MDSYDRFVEEIKAESADYTEQDWQIKSDRLKTFVDECYPRYKELMSNSEKVNFFVNTIRVSFYQGKIDGSVDLNFDDFETDLSEEFNELAESSQQEIEKWIKEELGTTLERVVDEILDGVNKIGNEIKNWLDKKE